MGQRRETIVGVRDGLIWMLAICLMLRVPCRHHMQSSGYETPCIYSRGVNQILEVSAPLEGRSRWRVKAIHRQEVPFGHHART